MEPEERIPLRFGQGNVDWQNGLFSLTNDLLLSMVVDKNRISYPSVFFGIDRKRHPVCSREFEPSKTPGVIHFPQP
jgi:hypothetical protein